MKPNLLALTMLSLLIGINETIAQQPAPTHLFGVYWDDDYLNVQGKGTDNAYTSGERFEYYYLINHPSRLFIDRLMPKAGDHATDIYGWSLMQVMYTPNEIGKTAFQPNDYPWSGALFATHSRFSYNTERSYAYKSEITLGMMGPASLAGPTQRMVHSMIHYTVPEGWSNQYGNSPLLNASFAVEKREWGSNSLFEMIGGARADAGTMLDGLTVYEMMRVGKMSPYFNGFFNLNGAGGTSLTGAGGTRKKSSQFYFFLKPQVQAVAYNAILQGGLFSWKPSMVESYSEDGKLTESPAKYHDISNLLVEVDFGWVLSMGNFSIAYTQKPSTPYMKGLYSHNVGNISIYKAW
jgi:lipid A 3-O-deacylase